MLFEANPNPVFDKKTLNGSLYLTTHRVIFMNNNAGNLRSFNMPFFCMRNVKLEQPIFGANYMKGTALAQEGGNFQGDVIWKMTFPKGGCIEFGQALLRATDMGKFNILLFNFYLTCFLASHARPFNAPPPYTANGGNYSYSAPPVYTPNNPEFQRAANTFREQPPDVYIYDTPPPYSGIYPTLNPQQNGPNNAAPYPAGQTNNSNPPYPASGNSTNPPYPTNAGFPYYPNANGSTTTAYSVNNTLAGNAVPSAPYEPPPPYEAPPLPEKKKED